MSHELACPLPFALFSWVRQHNGLMQALMRVQTWFSAMKAACYPLSTQIFLLNLHADDRHCNEVSGSLALMLRYVGWICRKTQQKFLGYLNKSFVRDMALSWHNPSNVLEACFRPHTTFGTIWDLKLSLICLIEFFCLCRIGTEHEKLGYYKSSHKRISYDSIRQLLSGLCERHSWDPIMEGEYIIGAEKDGQSVTIEPGGQFELSGAPVNTLHETLEETQWHINEVTQILLHLNSFSSVVRHCRDSHKVLLVTPVMTPPIILSPWRYTEVLWHKATISESIGSWPLIIL